MLGDVLNGGTKKIQGGSTMHDAMGLWRRSKKNANCCHKVKQKILISDNRIVTHLLALAPPLVTIHQVPETEFQAKKKKVVLKKWIIIDVVQKKLTVK